MALEVAFMVFILQLVFLHQWLIKHNLTSFDYILYLREKAKNPNAKLENIKENYKSKVIKKVEKESELSVVHTGEQKNDITELTIVRRPNIISQKMYCMK
jgi:hypothetical protein